jgi:hypothetical protein
MNRRERERGEAIREVVDTTEKIGYGESVMRIVLVLIAAALSVAAQSPAVQITNVSRPGSGFKVGDRFEVVITGAANQPVSVRTTMAGRTDWGPVAGWTDLSGRWSTTGQFEKSDFGDWSEVWTVGGKLASPTVHFAVGAPCLEGGQKFLMISGPNMSETCDTAAGRQSFTTPSGTDAFRTPDGRLVPGRTDQTAEQYQAEMLESLITSRASGVKARQRGDDAGAAIGKIIGANAISEDETRNVLAIVRTAFEKPEHIPQAAKDPSRTLGLLKTLSDSTDQENLKQQIAETMAYVRVQ